MHNGKEHEQYGEMLPEEAIAGNRAYVIISKQVERVSRDAVEALNSKDIILTFPH